MRHRMHPWCAAILVAISVTYASTSEATDVEEARVLKRRAFEAAERRAWKEAGDAFTASWRLVEDHVLACSLGIAEWQNGYWRGAAEHLPLCLKTMPQHEKFATGSKIEQMLAQAKAETASLTIEVNADGAKVVVDDIFMGFSPLAGGISVDPGTHVVEGRVPGRPRGRRVIDVAKGQSMRVLVEVPTSWDSETPVEPEERPLEEDYFLTSPKEKEAPSEAKVGAPKEKAVPWIAAPAPAPMPASEQPGWYVATRVALYVLGMGAAGALTYTGTVSVYEYYQAKERIVSCQRKLAQMGWERPCSVQSNWYTCEELAANEEALPWLGAAAAVSLVSAVSMGTLLTINFFQKDAPAQEEPRVHVSAGAGPSAVGITLRGNF